MLKTGDKIKSYFYLFFGPLKKPIYLERNTCMGTGGDLDTE